MISGIWKKRLVMVHNISIYVSYGDLTVGYRKISITNITMDNMDKLIWIILIN